MNERGRIREISESQHGFVENLLISLFETEESITLLNSIADCLISSQIKIGNDISDI